MTTTRRPHDKLTVAQAMAATRKPAPKRIRLTAWQTAMLERAICQLERDMIAERGDANDTLVCSVRKLSMLIADAGAIHVTPWEA